MMTEGMMVHAWKASVSCTRHEGLSLRQFKKLVYLPMKISLTSVSVGDQQKALDFYTKILGFIKKTDVPLGDARWLTVVSPEDQHGTELLLEPNATYPPMKQLKEALVNDTIPFTAFEVADIDAEFNRLKKLGVVFVQPPIKSRGAIQAIFDDTCGNLIQIYQIVPDS